MVYEPDEDSWLLQKEVENIVKKGMSVLDMGCGSGIQGITAAKNGANVVCADVDEESLEKTRTNCEREKVKVEIVKSDLFSNVDKKFDLIIFNAPYLPGEEFTDLDGGKEGYETAVEFIRQAKTHLNKNGKILLLISSLTKPRVIESKIKEMYFDYNIISRKKISWEELIIYYIYHAI